MTVFGMIAMRREFDYEGRAPRERGDEGGSDGYSDRKTFRNVKAVEFIPRPVDRPQTVEPVIDSAPAPDFVPFVLPPMLPADVPPPVPAPAPAPSPSPAPAKPATAAGFFDQELIPGVKNLYLVMGVAGGVVLLVLLSARKR